MKQSDYHYSERVAHLEYQNEEENRKNLRKLRENNRKIGKDWENIPILPTRGEKLVTALYYYHFYYHYAVKKSSFRLT